MSVSKYAYTPEFCDGVPCPGDCDFCGKRSEQARSLALQAGLCPYCKKPLEEERDGVRWCVHCMMPIREDWP